MNNIYSNLKEIFSKMKAEKKKHPFYKNITKNYWLKRSGVSYDNFVVGASVTYADVSYVIASIEKVSGGNMLYGLKKESGGTIAVSAELLYKDQLRHASDKFKLIQESLDLGRSIFREYFNPKANFHTFEDVRNIIEEVDQSNDRIANQVQEYRNLLKSSQEEAYKECLVNILLGVEAEMKKSNLEFNEKKGAWTKMSSKSKKGREAYIVSQDESGKYYINSESNPADRRAMGDKVRALEVLADLGFDQEEMEFKVLSKVTPQISQTITSFAVEGSFSVGDRVVSLTYGVPGTVIDQAPADKGGTEHDIDIVVNWDEPINGYPIFEVHPDEIRKFGDEEIKTKDVGNIQGLEIMVVDPKNIQSKLQDFRWGDLIAASYLTKDIDYIPDNEIWINARFFNGNKKLRETIASEIAIVHYMKQGIEYDVAKRMADVSNEEWKNKIFKMPEAPIKDELNCEDCEVPMVWIGEEESWKCPGCGKAKELSKFDNKDLYEGAMVAFTKNYNGSSFIKKGTIGIIHTIDGTKAEIDVLAKGGTRTIVSNFSSYLEKLKDSNLIKELNLDMF